MPPGTVTLILPVFAPLGTFALIWVAVSRVTVAFTPSNVTFVAPERCVPLIVTTSRPVPKKG